MSAWEVLVAEALERLAIAFVPQVAFAGGPGILGGMRVDFLLPDYNAILRPMGYWHSLPHRRARDELQRQYLEARGYRVIDLFEADIERLDEVLPEKLGVPIRARR
jgi:very-short-patch-repair endonuclease